MANDFKYALDKRTKKHTCPGCEKKTFTRYVYTDSLEHVGEDFGRCDRENNCNYHRHPTEDESFKPAPQPKVELPPVQVINPKSEFVANIAAQQNSNFHTFCRSLGITDYHLGIWGVGASINKTAFILLNRKGEALNIKFVTFTTEGKRDKTPGENAKLKYPPYYLGKAYLKKESLLQPDQEDDWQKYYTFQRCFYGEHLWSPEKDTCLVESEKTAVIASFFFPEYNWLATGGNHGMKFEQFELFYGYTKPITNLVDNDRAGYLKSKTVEWLRRLAQIRKEDGSIKSINIFSKKAHGYDLADAIINDNYQDPKQLAYDIRHTLDVSVTVRINEETGEVILEEEKETLWDEKELKRAKQTVERLVNGEKNILSETGNYATVGKALAVFGKKGRELFHQLASMSKSYDHYQADADFDSFSLFNKNRNAKDFFKLAKEAGVDTFLLKSLQPRAAEGAGDIEEDDYQEFWYNLPEGCELTDAIRKDTTEYNFIEYKNSYYAAKFDYQSKQINFNQISNFTVRPLFLIQSKTDPKRIFEIKNCFGERYIIDMPTKALTSQAEFNVFVESQGNFLLDASKPQFTKIKRKLYNLTRNAEEIKTLGWHKDGFYAFANGIYNAKFSKISEHGIITHNVALKEEDEALEKHYFIPAMSSIYKDEDDLYESEKKFVFVDRKDVDFQKWVTLFHQCYGENGIFGLCFYITSLFRDHIYSRFKFFPHLFLFGPPGTGKSTMAWSLNYMFGLERKPFMLNAGTAVGFHRTFAQFRNAIVWFDEYSNQIDFKRVQDLKGAYDGAGHVKGEWSQGGGSSNKTVSTPVHSSCVISGQELPIADNALFKRVILLQYYQTEFTEAEKKRMDNLKEMQEKGLSHITGMLSQFRPLILKNYFKVFEEVEREFSQALEKDTGIETRIVLNACIIATTFKILEKELSWPFNWEMLKSTFVRGIRTQNGLIANAKETSQFWDQVDFLLNTNQIKDSEDFKIELKSEIKLRLSRNETVSKAFGKSTEVLFIRLSKIHPLYMQSLRQQGEKKGMDRGSLEHYLKHSPGYIGAVDSTNFKFGDRSMQSSAYCFDYAYLEEMGYNFKRFVDGEEPIPDLPPNFEQRKADF